ncbi:MAG: cobalamin-dependent protein, partial [Dehalococcoidia bacterium]|nr:cobalamin-dependent protein [Dehalococcoidia bacterium]
MGTLRVTLIYAGIVGKGFNSVGQGLDSGWISHGLCHLSACAKQAGFEVDLIDLRALRDWDHFRAEIAARGPQVCGLTMMSVDYNPVMRCVDLIKEVDAAIVTVVGGPHPTLVAEEVATNPNVDYIITHEGEITCVKLLQDLQAASGVGGRGSGDRDQTTALRGKQLAVSLQPSAIGPSTLNPQPSTRILRGEAPNLDELPYSDRGLFLDEWRKFGYTLNSPEVPLANLPVPFVTIIAGRGCIYNCSFCQPAEKRIFGAKVRRRSVANVIGELEDLRDKYRFNSLMIHDDCLTEDREWVKAFCQAYREHGFKQPFWCQSRADLIVRYEDMVELMVGAGLKGFFIG